MSETNKNKTGQRNTATSRSSAARSQGTKKTASSGRTASQKSSVDRVAAVKSARNSGGTASPRRTSTNRRRKRRRQSPDFAKILLIVIGIVIGILCLAVGLKGCAKDGDTPTKEVPTTEVPETEIRAEITVNGISVNGLTKSEAMDKILAELGWDMHVTYSGEKVPVENLMAYNVDKVLEEALGKGSAGSYSVDTDGLEEYVSAAVAAMADGWDVQPKNGSISAYDKATGEFQFAAAEKGMLIEREVLAADILAAIDGGDYDSVIEAVAKEVQPEISEADAKANFKRLGTYTTTTTNNKARNENVRLASEAINGMIIQPGEEFSFNLTTGNRTPEKGYKPAGAYVNGVLVEEPGGGVCQVSSTLYNAVVFSGLKTTERHAHSYEPSYVIPGEDAMVSYDGYSGPDMKFINNSKTAVGIKTSFSNQKLTVSVYGNPILEDGVTLSMVSTKVKELDPPAPVYEEDQTLEPGVEVEAKAATMGSRWATRLVTKKDGVVISESHLHNSTYKGKSATIKRNTSGVVIPTEGPSTEASVSAEPSGETEGTVTQEPTTAPANGPGGNAQPTEPVTPGSSTQPTSPAQNAGPGEVIVPSTPGGSTGGPGGMITPGGTSQPTTTPQGPSDVTAPGNGPGTAPPQTSTPGSSGPGGAGQTAETSAGPGNMGLIAPIG